MFKVAYGFRMTKSGSQGGCVPTVFHSPIPPIHRGPVRKAPLIWTCKPIIPELWIHDDE